MALIQELPWGSSNHMSKIKWPDIEFGPINLYSLPSWSDYMMEEKLAVHAKCIEVMNGLVERGVSPDYVAAIPLWNGNYVLKVRDSNQPYAPDNIIIVDKLLYLVDMFNKSSVPYEQLEEFFEINLKDAMQHAEGFNTQGEYIWKVMLGRGYINE